MAPIDKFKSEIGVEFYKQKVTEFAVLKNVQAAVQDCDSCGQIQFCHDPGPCTRSAKSESEKSLKFDKEQLTEIKSCINRDIIGEIIRLERNNDSKEDRLASALDRISEVLGQNCKGPTQVTKAKVPPTWAKESFADYKEEVEAWEKAHPGDTFVKYSEFLNELKKNKSKSGLSDYVSTIVVEKTRINKSVSAILTALEEKYELTKREKFENLIISMNNFKPSKNDSGEYIFSQIEKIETAFNSLDVGNNVKFFLATFLLKKTFENDVINDIEKREIQDLIDNKSENNFN